MDLVSRAPKRSRIVFRLSRRALVPVAVLALVASVSLGATQNGSGDVVHQASTVSVRCRVTRPKVEPVLLSAAKHKAKTVAKHKAKTVVKHKAKTVVKHKAKTVVKHKAKIVHARVVATTCRIATVAVHTKSATLTSTSAPISVGVAMDGAPFDMQPLNAYSQLLGRAPSIMMWYRQWNEPLLAGSEVTDVLNRGMTPIITWEPFDPNAANASTDPNYSLSAILSGKYDAYIEGAAQQAAAVGRPMLINFAPEMNGDWESWGPAVNGNTASQYVAVWRHVVGIFRAAGATNVGWIWDPNALWNSATTYRAYYPGDAWVDWVGMDGYNFGTTTSDGWLSPLQIFSGSYASLRALTHKPIIIEETASAEAGGSKSAWITSLETEIPKDLPAVRALVWFNRDKETDWRVNSSSAALKSFQHLVASRAWSGGSLDVHPLS
jgi:beta-mannanase